MSPEPTGGGSKIRVGRILAKILLHVVLPVGVLVGAWFGAQHLIATAPTTKKKPPTRSARMVEVVEVVRTSASPTLHAMGLVKPAREVMVRPRVTGAIESIADHFEPGGRFLENEQLVCLDVADFDLAVSQASASRDQAKTEEAQARTALAQARATLEQRRATLAEAEANLKLEEGNQAIARREFEMLGDAAERANPELVLRTPQLAIAKAAVASAGAGVEAGQAGIEAAEAGVEAAVANVDVADVRVKQAELDRTRTCVRAPFNAWIRERFVEVGSVVGPNTDVASLVGTDAYWVEVTLPMSDLQWLRLPVDTNEGGALVTIRDEAAWGPDGTRQGRLVRLLGDLETAGRLARVLVEVEDPLHLEAEAEDRHPLLTGSYVRAEIKGRSIDDVVELDRAWLRHGDVVWVVDMESRLRIRPVEIPWRGRDQVFVRNSLETGDRVITTDLAAPVDGMPVRVRGETPAPEEP